MGNEYLRDRHMVRNGLVWNVWINKKLICDGFQTRQQAHDFIDTDIKPLMEKEESRKTIERMNKDNLMGCIVNDYDGKQRIMLGLGKPNTNLLDFEGL